MVGESHCWSHNGWRVTLMVTQWLASHTEDRLRSIVQKYVEENIKGNYSFLEFCVLTSSLRKCVW